MQTFMPYPSFTESAKVLDMRRLGKQRVEVLQILKALHGESKGWTNHPIVRAWRTYELPLIIYGVCVCDEWIKRGYKDTCRDKILSYADTRSSEFIRAWGAVVTSMHLSTLRYPTWLSNLQLYSSYRALLLHKDPIHYGQFGWSESPIEKLDYSLFQV